MISDAELADLATSHDIIAIGMLADDLRRQRHGTNTTFVRVATTPADVGADVVRPPSAGRSAADSCAWWRRRTVVTAA